MAQESIGPPAESPEQPKDYGDTDCSICLELMIEPYKTNCSHVFCKFCLLKVFMTGSVKACPMCRRMVTEANEMTDLNGYIEAKLVGELGEAEKKSRDENLDIRKNDPEIKKLGEKPFEILLVGDFLVGHDGQIFHNVRNEYGQVTDIIVTYNGQILPRIIYQPVINEHGLRQWGLGAL